MAGLAQTPIIWKSTFAQDTINNASGGGTTAEGQLSFATGITYKNLWLTHSGNDLVISLLGTNDTITLSGWFGTNAGSQVQSINTASGLNLSNSAVAQLVSAMATYQANNSTFNPATATQMPVDATLQAAITLAWTASANYTGVSVATAVANQSALDTVTGGYKVVDTAANVVAGLAFLTSDASHIASITLTDSSTPTLALTSTEDSAYRGSWQDRQRL